MASKKFTFDWDNFWIFSFFGSLNKKTRTKENLMKEMKKYKPEVLMTLGAGDIDTFIVPLKKYYSPT